MKVHLVDGTYELFRHYFGAPSHITSEGYEVGIRSRLCWTFTGPCDLTLYPSGKLMVKTQDKALAQSVAEQHVTVWAHS